MTGNVTTSPGSKLVRLQMDDGYEKVLSIEQALALRSALTKAVHRAQDTSTPWNQPMFDRMDDAWIYVRMAEKQTMAGLYFLGRRNGVYVSVMADVLGISPVLYSSTRPSMKGLKPYVMFKDFQSAMPFLMRYRQVYRDRFLADCGLTHTYLKDERFVEAVETPDGCVMYLTESLLRDGRTRQSVHLIDIDNGYNQKRNRFSGDANYPFIIRSDYRRLTKEEAYEAAAHAAESWYDLMIEMVRPWFPDGPEGGVGQ